LEVQQRDQWLQDEDKMGMAVRQYTKRSVWGDEEARTRLETMVLSWPYDSVSRNRDPELFGFFLIEQLSRVCRYTTIFTRTEKVQEKLYNGLAY